MAEAMQGHGQEHPAVVGRAPRRPVGHTARDRRLVEQPGGLVNPPGPVKGGAGGLAVVGLRGLQGGQAAGGRGEPGGVGHRPGAEAQAQADQYNAPASSESANRSSRRVQAAR